MLFRQWIKENPKKTAAALSALFFIVLFRPLPERQSGDLRLYSQEGELIYTHHDPDDPVEAEPAAYPAHLKHLVILAEDSRFYIHPGVDPLAVIRSAVSLISNGRIISGASTITQQTVRSLYPDYMPRSLYFRKAYEMYFAVRYELYHSKKDILIDFLNHAPLGRNRAGFEAASLFYFQKSAAILNCSESAALVVLLRNPSMKQDGFEKRYIHLASRYNSGEKEYDCRFESPDLLYDRISSARAGSAGVAESLLQNNLPADSPHLGVYLRTHAGFNGNLRSTIDAGLQNRIRSIVENGIRTIEDRGANQAAVAVIEIPENHKGEFLLRVLVGSADTKKGAGQVNGAMVIHDAGSVLKPFVYALAFDLTELRPYSLVDDSDLSLTDPVTGALYRPSNHDMQFMGRIPVREALASSRNVPAIRVLNRTGTGPFYQLLKDSGFSHLKAESHYGPSIVLGSSGASVLQVASLYGALANHGKLLPVRILESPDFHTGPEKELFSKDSAMLITHILSDQTARRPGFGRRNFLDFPYDVAAKTGTSKDFRDSWTAGYTDRYAVAVWAGNLTGDATLGVSGIWGAGRIFHQVIRLLTDRSPNQFEYPESWQMVPVCRITGHLASGSCPARTEPVLPHDPLPVTCTKKHDGSVSTANHNERWIQSPADGSVYYTDPHRPSDAQEIAVQISESAPSGISISVNGKVYPAAAGSTIWIPPHKGSYTVRARFKNRTESVTFRVE